MWNKTENWNHFRTFYTCLELDCHRTHYTYSAIHRALGIGSVAVYIQMSKVVCRWVSHELPTFQNLNLWTSDKLWTCKNMAVIRLLSKFWQLIDLWKTRMNKCIEFKGKYFNLKLNIETYFIYISLKPSYEAIYLLLKLDVNF